MDGYHPHGEQHEARPKRIRVVLSLQPCTGIATDGRLDGTQSASQ